MCVCPCVWREGKREEKGEGDMIAQNSRERTEANVNDVVLVRACESCAERVGPWAMPGCRVGSHVVRLAEKVPRRKLHVWMHFGVGCDRHRSTLRLRTSFQACRRRPSIRRRRSPLRRLRRRWKIQQHLAYRIFSRPPSGSILYGTRSRSGTPAPSVGRWVYCAR